MRRRRHWGWGYEDDPVGEGAAELAAHLGFGSAELERPAPLRGRPRSAPCTRTARRTSTSCARCAASSRTCPTWWCGPTTRRACCARSSARTPRTSRSRRTAAGRAWSAASTRWRAAMSLDLGAARPRARGRPRLARRADPGRRHRPADRAAARRARDDAALLPAVVRALDARRLDRHPRRRALRHRADAHRRPRRVDPRGHARAARSGSRAGCPRRAPARRRTGCCSARRARSR